VDWLFDIINSLFKEIGEAGEYFIGRLPPSPLHWVGNFDNEILAWVNWLVPIGEMIVIGQGWLLCIGAWYVVRPILKWVNIAGG